MKMKQLGRTGLMVTENGFGALPIQRLDETDGPALLRKAYEKGINFFDTARAYTCSEGYIGKALSPVRDQVYIATKSWTDNRTSALADLETSLKNMKTDYVDIWQLHNIQTMPDLNDPESPHHALLQAKKEGKTRFIGITSHRRDVAIAAAKSGLYDTVQFPLSYLSTEEDCELIKVCKENNVGLIAMKAMSGGLAASSKAAFAFFTQYDNVVPIWGCQHEWELEEFLQYAEEGVAFTPEMQAIAEKDRRELGEKFCRGCGYCKAECPAGININDVARIAFIIQRGPWRDFTTPKWIEMVKQVENCVECGYCKSRCPYQLDTPALLKENYEYYMNFCKEKGLL